MLCILWVVLLSNHPSIWLWLFSIESIVALANSMKHLLIRLSHVDAAIQVFVHLRLHLCIYDIFLFLSATQSCHRCCRMALKVVVQSWWWVDALLSFGPTNVQMIALVCLMSTIWLVVSDLYIDIIVAALTHSILAKISLDLLPMVLKCFIRLLHHRCHVLLIFWGTVVIVWGCPTRILQGRLLVLRMRPWCLINVLRVMLIDRYSLKIRLRWFQWVFGRSTWGI